MTMLWLPWLKLPVDKGKRPMGAGPALLQLPSHAVLCMLANASCRVLIHTLNMPGQYLGASSLMCL